MWVEAYIKASEKSLIKTDHIEIFPWRLLVSAVLDNLCHIGGICIVFLIYIVQQNIKNVSTMWVVSALHLVSLPHNRLLKILIKKVNIKKFIQKNKKELKLLKVFKEHQNHGNLRYI